VGAALVGVPVACASTRATAPLDARFVAVHNTLSAMGLSQMGPIAQGLLERGGEARIPLALPAGCVTIVSIGADGIRDLDATLVDARSAPVAHDTTDEPQAVLRPCLETADAYTLVVRAAAGSGSWVSAVWVGGLGAPAPSASGAAEGEPAEANGTCQAPIPLSLGVVTGSTTHGEHENAGSCGPSDSRELVYELDVAQRERVTIDVEAKFDSVLYVRKDDCNDATAEVACNDDAGDRSRSHVEHVLDPGKYFVFVDGYGHDAGSFKMTVEASEVVSLSDACRRAPLLADGVMKTGTSIGLSDEAHASCGGGASGPDAPWQARVAERSRVRVVDRSSDAAPVVHLRRLCVDEASEVACADSGAASGEAAVVGVFDAGRYTVFADSHDQDAAGRYSLLFETAPLAGAGVESDGCDDAGRLEGGEAGGSLLGDTFAARDDIAGSCGGAGAADVVYRVEVPRRSRLMMTLDGEEALHLVDVFRRCGDRSTEVGCGRTIDEVVAPGTYYVAVDGASVDAFGRFALHWWMHDVSGQASAGADAPELVPGRVVSATTAGSPDRFDVGCSATGPAPTGPDRTYKIVLDHRSKVRLTLKAPSFDALLGVRRARVDTPGDALAEITCEAPPESSRRTTTLVRTLDPGAYWVVVDGASSKDEGPFSLEYRLGL
jgi:hypothetical protein